MQQNASRAASGAAASTTSYTDVARSIYDAFGRGDIAGVLALFDPDIEWREAEGNPYQPDGTAWIGRQRIGELFVRLGEEWDGFSLHDIRLTPTLEGVVTECRYRGTFKATGRSVNMQVAHVLRIRDGLLTHFQQYADTATLQWTMGADSPRGDASTHGVQS